MVTVEEVVIGWIKSGCYVTFKTNTLSCGIIFRQRLCFEKLGISNPIVGRLRLVAELPIQNVENFDPIVVLNYNKYSKELNIEINNPKIS